MLISSLNSPKADAAAWSRAVVARDSGVWRWLGRVPFAATQDLQERTRDDLLRGTAQETLFLCEHDPVITLGRAANQAHVLAGADALAARGIAVARATRGGDVTFHGPGQLVGYPVVRVRGGVVRHVEAMAHAIIDVLGGLGVKATWRRATPGLWVDDAKICAFGVHVRHRVAIHGFALNLASSDDAFSLIVPCGLPSARVTSVSARIGAAPTAIAMAPSVAAAISAAFGLSFARVG